MLKQLMLQLVQMQTPEKNLKWYTMIDGHSLYCICENYEIHKSLKLIITEFANNNVSVHECSTQASIGALVRPTEECSSSEMYSAIVEVVAEYLKYMDKIGEDL